ncbi:MAG TPA: hypothetical protein VMT50_04415, partial [Steroidobacteraceae bacterium]|nr:hypothetical protein [Steroidobacteraceae bacterium]
ALKNAKPALDREIDRDLQTLWPQAVSVTEAEYCRREACGAPEHDLFMRMAKAWEPAAPAQPVAHPPSASAVMAKTSAP